jgi:hypothetical protein
MRSKFKGDTRARARKFAKSINPSSFVNDGCELKFNKQRYIETSETKGALET